MDEPRFCRCFFATGGSPGLGRILSFLNLDRTPCLPDIDRVPCCSGLDRVPCCSGSDRMSCSSGLDRVPCFPGFPERVVTPTPEFPRYILRLYLAYHTPPGETHANCRPTDRSRGSDFQRMVHTPRSARRRENRPSLRCATGGLGRRARRRRSRTARGLAFDIWGASRKVPTRITRTP